MPDDTFGAPNKTELTRLQRRRRRLRLMAESVKDPNSAMRTLTGRTEATTVWVRDEFVDKTLSGVPLVGDPSDRRLSVKADRPAAARLITPRGAALRVYLTALFEAQTRVRPGQRPGNTRPLAPPSGGVLPWIDLLASDAEPSGKGKYRMNVTDKKIRQMGSALDTLVKEGLVELTATGQPGAKKYEGFLLNHEVGRRPHGTPMRYQVPVVPPERAFPLPSTLFTNGWVHVLEDSELAFILMAAAIDRTVSGLPFAIDADTRLHQFGMKHDGYEAHMMLSQLGLVSVTPDIRRRPDGTVEDFHPDGSGLHHSIRFTPAGFDRDAFTVLTEEIDRQLGAVPQVA